MVLDVFGIVDTSVAPIAVPGQVGSRTGRVRIMQGALGWVGFRMAGRDCRGSLLPKRHHEAGVSAGRESDERTVP